MSRHLNAIGHSALLAIVLVGLVQIPGTPAQPAAQPARPTFETTKVEGTDHVYTAEAPGCRGELGRASARTAPWGSAHRQEHAVMGLDWSRATRIT